MPKDFALSVLKISTNATHWLGKPNKNGKQDGKTQINYKIGYV